MPAIPWSWTARSRWPPARAWPWAPIPGTSTCAGSAGGTSPAEPAEIERDVLYQVGALMAFARAHGAPVTHVKPHGALYNQAAVDDAVARAVARGVARAGQGADPGRPVHHHRHATRGRGRGPALRGRGLRRPPLQRRRHAAVAKDPGAVITEPASGGRPGGDASRARARVDVPGGATVRALRADAVRPRRQPLGRAERPRRAPRAPGGGHRGPAARGVSGLTRPPRRRVRPEPRARRRGRRRDVRAACAPSTDRLRRASRSPGVIETVPTFRALLVLFDPGRVSAGGDRRGRAGAARSGARRRTAGRRCT